MSSKRFLSMFAILLLAVALALGFTACDSSHNSNNNITETEPKEYTAKELYNQAVKYVGEIVTYDKNGDEYALGTGFVISSDGKIVTNYHVIEGAYSADITINDKKYTIASVLAYDANIDLAVLKINASGLTAATISKLPVDVGSTVYAIGSSRGMTNTYSQGIITYADRVIDDISYVQHDASITNGNSGGPLINIYGEVIGINTWGISDSQNLNFAIFADELDNLKYNFPISLADLTRMNLNPYQILVDWVLNNATEVYDEDERVEYSEEWDEDTECGLFYDYANGGSLTIFHLSLSEKSTTYTAFTIRQDSDFWDCGFSATLNATGESMGAAYGQIPVATYNYGDKLTYTHYFGEPYMEEVIGNSYNSSMVFNIEWLRVFLEEKDFDITLIDLGFVSYEYP